MPRKNKRKPRKPYHWDTHALFTLFLQGVSFSAFVIWCLCEHIPARYSVPPIIVGFLVLSAVFLHQIAKARQDNNWWDDDNCSGWRGY